MLRAFLATFLSTWRMAKRTLLLSSYALRNRKYKQRPAMSRFQGGVRDCVQGKQKQFMIKHLNFQL